MMGTTENRGAAETAPGTTERHWRSHSMSTISIPTDPRKYVLASSSDYLRPQPESVFWQRVAIPGAEGCWIWFGAFDATHGYGAASDSRPHRITYEMANGRIPDGLMVRHKCNVRLCVNPSHLEAGTCQDNANDRLAARRTRDTISLQDEIAMMAHLVAGLRELFPKPNEIGESFVAAIDDYGWPLPISIERQFFERDGDCMKWLGTKRSTDGRAIVLQEYVTRIIHRRLSGNDIDHRFWRTCDIPSCINPDHWVSERLAPHVCNQGHQMSQLSTGRWTCNVCTRDRHRRANNIDPSKYRNRKSKKEAER